MEEQVPASTDPLAIASVILSVVGFGVYCCGSFFCLGWIAPIFWIIGLVLGVVSLARGASGTSKVLAIVGIVLNLLAGFAMVALVVFGVGLGALSAFMDQGSSSY